MVRIFKDANGTGQFVIQTTCTDVQSFISDLSEAMHKVITTGSCEEISQDGGVSAMGILQNAMPIAFKLAGYKAESVSEQRTLVCGDVSPNSCAVVASAGR
jgi:hypothetical protein